MCCCLSYPFIKILLFPFLVNRSQTVDQLRCERTSRMLRSVHVRRRYVLFSHNAPCSYRPQHYVNFQTAVLVLLLVLVLKWRRYTWSPMWSSPRPDRPRTLLEPTSPRPGSGTWCPSGESSRVTRPFICTSS